MHDFVLARLHDRLFGSRCDLLRGVCSHWISKCWRTGIISKQRLGKGLVEGVDELCEDGLLLLGVKGALLEDRCRENVVFVRDRGGKEAVDVDTLPEEMLLKLDTLFRG